MYSYPNNTNNPYITEYNRICSTGICESDRKKLGYTKKDLKIKGMGIHHIIPRSFDPSLTNDPENQVWLDFYSHTDAHYQLWRGLNTNEAAMAMWFIYIYGRKNLGYKIPEEDDKLLTESVKTFLKEHKNK